MEFKGRIVIFSTTNCSQCSASKSMLESLNLPYHDINVEKYPDQRNMMTKFSGKSNLPQIFFNEKYVGGNDDFQALGEDEMHELIKYVSENPASDDSPQPLHSNGVGKDDLSNGTCEKIDEMADFVEDIKHQSGIILNHRQLFHSYPKTFTGKDIITYISNKEGLDRNRAAEIAQQLIDKKFAASLKIDQPMKDDKTLYRLLEDIPSKALNAGLPAYKCITSASDISTLLRESLLTLYAKYVSSDGKSVDYVALGQSCEFANYVQLTAQLQRVQLKNFNEEEKRSFFINVYNALVIHGNIKLGFPKSTYQRFKFFNKASYIIGGHTYSLQDIENGILRSNQKGVGMMKKPFSKTDPRLEYILSPPEPLVHMALTSGAKSSPPLKVYSDMNIMDELQLSTSSFLESDDGCCVDAEESLVGLSLIFKWYKEDFGSSPYEVLKWVKNHMGEGKKKQELANLLEEKVYNLTYLTYDWETNKKE